MAKVQENQSAQVKAIECSLILIDLSGFTQLVYQASYKEELFMRVALAMKRLFDEAVRAAEADGSIRIISTTGDGFFALATGRTPSRTALSFAQEMRAHFDGYLQPAIGALPFRQRIDLRIAMHHGIVHEMHIGGLMEGGYPVYISDDLNLLSRVINTQVARRHGTAITRPFYRRLTMNKTTAPVADEVILDRNRYPEPIEVYKLPADIPKPEQGR